MEETPKIEHKFEEDVEKRLASLCLDNEVVVVGQNRRMLNDDFEAYIDHFDCIRSEKEYSWMSDIYIPEFVSIILAQIADDVSQYFQTRDFVEAYVMDDSDEALKSAAASQECINRTLNRKKLYHYQKYVRSRIISKLSGEVVAMCWWEQDLKKIKVGEELDPETNEKIKDLYDYEIRKDCFNYDILDPRNVFYDDVYTYSLQDKDWVTIREETSYDKLRKQKKSHGYFNLDLVKALKPSGDTETKRETRGRDNPTQTVDNHISPRLDKYTRFGKMWYLNGGPGVDADNNVLDGATLEECICTFVTSGSSRVLIGFHKTPYKDSRGRPYRPLLRGLCYIHPTSDGGAGDGKYARELQIGINDTFNLTNDRTRLATMPTLKGKKYTTEDNDSIYFAPEHIMEVNETDDIVEFRIDSDIMGGMNQMAVLTDKLRQVVGTQPPDLGQVPALASTTATAASLASAGTGKRSNYKSMSFENTFLADLYWMILQMTWQFAKPETGFKLMGQKVYDFNPDNEYYYRPLSQSIEAEHSKAAKRQEISQMLGYLINLVNVNPSAINAVNALIAKFMTLMGDEYSDVLRLLIDPNQTQTEGGAQAGVQGRPQIGAPSNQNGVGMGSAEMGARGLV